MNSKCEKAKNASRGDCNNCFAEHLSDCEIDKVNFVTQYRYCRGRTQPTTPPVGATTYLYGCDLGWVGCDFGCESQCKGSIDPSCRNNCNNACDDLFKLCKQACGKGPVLEGVFVTIQMTIVRIGTVVEQIGTGGDYRNSYSLIRCYR
jgi:hypothetical protein